MTQNEPPSPQLRKKRQLLLVLPLLILPFVTLAFWALGGGVAVDTNNINGQDAVGINPIVPRANLSARMEDKMTMYAEADQLSTSGREASSRLGYQLEADSVQGGRASAAGERWREDGPGLESRIDLSHNASLAFHSQKMEEKLAALQVLLKQSGEGVESGSGFSVLPIAPVIPAAHPFTDRLRPKENLERPSEKQAGSLSAAQYGSGADLEGLNRLNEQMAQATDQGGGEEDGETRQINAMLDKILAIQHSDKSGGKEGDREVDKLLALSKANSGRVYQVNTAEEDEDLQVPVLVPEGYVRQPVILPSSVENSWTGPAAKGLTNAGTIDGTNRGGVSEVKRKEDREDLNGLGGLKTEGNAGFTKQVAVAGTFYDIDGGGVLGGGPGSDGGDDLHYTLSAIIAQTQTLVSGATVKLQLTADVIVHGTLIPKGNFVFGTCSISAERLKVQITHIRFQRRLFAVGLTVFDMDGMEGVRIPGAIGRDASKEGADRALQSVQMMSLDPSVTAQAASAGIEATKGLLRKKVKLVRVTVKAGYPVLLLDAAGQQTAK